MVLLVRFLAAAPGCPFSTPSAVLGVRPGGQAASSPSQRTRPVLQSLVCFEAF